MEMMIRQCSIPECTNKVWHKNYCTKHYQRWRKHGDPNIVLPSGFQPGESNPSKRPEHRLATSKRLRGGRLQEEHKVKIRESMKKALQSPELKEKWRKNQLGRKPTEETRRKISESHAKRPKKLSTLWNYADAAFSKYIRRKYLREDGLLECWSCHKLHAMSEMDCGHFVGRQHKATRFLEENCHPQCRYCNRYIEGNKDAYALSLVKHYGPDILERLQVEKHKTLHLLAADLIEIINRYKAKLAEFPPN